MKPLSYKPEIDGLRTIAVLAVILYHINPKWLPSGFIGVDIFLVISGYLITKIIVATNEAKTFSIVDFYARRVKRIIPLTYFLLVAILAAGWFISYPATFRPEANSTLSALFFAANLRFALMGDYFTSQDDNPLLHLWSLSLEEQFYFVWPLIILALFKFKSKSKLPLLLIGLTLLSVALSIYFAKTPSLAPFTYYVLPTRMTGLLVGAFLAVVSLNINKESKLLSLVGLGLIVVSTFAISKDIFPGPIVLLPLLGSALIILTPSATPTKMVFANPIAQNIGKISFSLYMWHWPLLVFTNRYSKRHDLNIDWNNIGWLAAYFVVLFALSYLSYVFIENYFRKQQYSKAKTFGLVFLVPLLAIGAASLYISKGNGVPSRYGLTEKMTRMETINCANSLIKDFCYLHQGDDANSMILVGDSHAGAMNHFVAKLAKDKNLTTYEASANGCSFFDENFSSAQCEKTKNKIATTLATKGVKTILVVKRYDIMDKKEVAQLISFIETKATEGFKVVLFRQIPKLDSDTYSGTKFMDRYLAGKVPATQATDQYDKSGLMYDDVVNASLAGHSNVLLIHPTATLCGEGTCRILDRKGKPLYFDDDHLSAYGAEWVYDQYKSQPEFAKLSEFMAADAQKPQILETKLAPTAP